MPSKIKKKNSEQDNKNQLPSLITNFKLDDSSELPEGEVLVRFSTKDQILRFDYHKWEFILLQFKNDADSISLDRLNNKASVQLDHEQGFFSNIGVVLEADHEKARVKFDINSELGKEVYRKVKEGFINHVSMGTEILSKESKGKFKYGDKEFDLYKVTKHQPFEISFVTVPALKGANVLKASMLQKIDENICIDNESSINLKAEDKNMPPKLKPETENLETQTLENDKTLEFKPVDTEALEKEILNKEIKRQQDIRACAVELGVTDTEVIETFCAKSTFTVQDAKLGFFEHLKKTEEIVNPVGGVNVNLGKSKELEQKNRAKLAIQERILTDSSEEFANYGSSEILNMLLPDGAKFSAPHRENPMTIIKLAHEISDFQSILQDSGNRILQEQLESKAITYNQVGKEVQVKDLRKVDLPALDKVRNLDSVTEDSKYSRTTLTESKATLDPKTKGLEIGITERAIMNDDLGAFRNVMQDLAEAIMRTRNETFYATLAGYTFPANRQGNFAPTIQGLTDLKTFIRRYKIETADGKEVQLKTLLDLIVAPPELEGDLMQVLFGQYTPNVVGDVNSFRMMTGGKVGLVIDEDLTNPTNFYGLGPKTGSRAPICYYTKKGASNGQMDSYFENQTRRLVMQATDYFDVTIASNDNMVKSTYSG